MLHGDFIEASAQNLGQFNPSGDRVLRHFPEIAAFFFRPKSWNVEGNELHPARRAPGRENWRQII